MTAKHIDVLFGGSHPSIGVVMKRYPTVQSLVDAIKSKLNVKTTGLKSNLTNAYQNASMIKKPTSVASNVANSRTGVDADRQQKDPTKPAVTVRSDGAVQSSTLNTMPITTIKQANTGRVAFDEALTGTPDPTRHGLPEPESVGGPSVAPDTIGTSLVLPDEGEQAAQQHNDLVIAAINTDAEGSKDDNSGKVSNFTTTIPGAELSNNSFNRVGAASILSEFAKQLAHLAKGDIIQLNPDDTIRVMAALREFGIAGLGDELKAFGRSLLDIWNLFSSSKGRPLGSLVTFEKAIVRDLQSKRRQLPDSERQRIFETRITQLQESLKDAEGEERKKLIDELNDLNKVLGRAEVSDAPEEKEEEEKKINPGFAEEVKDVGFETKSSGVVLGSKSGDLTPAQRAARQREIGRLSRSLFRQARREARAQELDAAQLPTDAFWNATDEERQLPENRIMVAFSNKLGDFIIKLTPHVVNAQQLQGDEFQVLNELPSGLPIEHGHQFMAISQSDVSRELLINLGLASGDQVLQKNIDTLLASGQQWAAALSGSAGERVHERFREAVGLGSLPEEDKDLGGLAGDGGDAPKLPVGEEGDGLPSISGSKFSTVQLVTNTVEQDLKPFLDEAGTAILDRSAEEIARQKKDWILFDFQPDIVDYSNPLIQQNLRDDAFRFQEPLQVFPNAEGTGRFGSLITPEGRSYGRLDVVPSAKDLKRNMDDLNVKPSAIYNSLKRQRLDPSYTHNAYSQGVRSQIDPLGLTTNPLNTVMQLSNQTFRPAPMFTVYDDADFDHPNPTIHMATSLIDNHNVIHPPRFMRTNPNYNPFQRPAQFKFK